MSRKPSSSPFQEALSQPTCSASWDAEAGELLLQRRAQHTVSTETPPVLGPSSCLSAPAGALSVGTLFSRFGELRHLAPQPLSIQGP